tara:strand:- start:3138 stop:3668 length:531 start_codon:yes stop_codon:yes gene_type:complete
MSTDINTLNLADNGDGMVSLNDNPATSFVNNNPQMPPPNREAFSHSEKNLGQSKEMTMDSTPINDLMMEPPMIGEEPKMQSMQMAAPNPQGAYAAPQQQAAPESKNPLNLTDDQMIALVAGAAAALAVSKPVQDKLVTSIPKFLNEQGSRSMVGLASTGLVAAIVFYIVKDYVVKP